MLGLAGGVYFLPGDVTPAQSRDRTPAEIIAFRFPANWGFAQPQTSGVAISVPQRVASVQAIGPEAPYALASADTRSVSVGLPSRFTSPQEQALPTQALAYSPATQAVTKRTIVTPQQHEPRAALTATPRPVKQSSNVFTDSEIAAIKAKLRLSPQQQQYWPAVASALRNIDYIRHPGGKSASIDANSPGVQQLKSAAFPLIMSFDEEQKSQVRQLARNMGLEQVASAF